MLTAPVRAGQTLVLDARGFPSEGGQSLARFVVRAYHQGWKTFVVFDVHGQRFMGNGFGPGSGEVRIDVYGSSGDYPASGLDGMEIVVIFILGNAAGRPLINAVGRSRVVINGTALDYLAESFMAGDPLDGGGFCILNGVAFDAGGSITDLDTPYPGGNLFSLASGGAIYARDPLRRLDEEQLNGGRYADLTDEDWQLILPYLQENTRLFSIPVERLLTVDGRTRAPQEVYRKIAPIELSVLK